MKTANTLLKGWEIYQSNNLRNPLCLLIWTDENGKTWKHDEFWCENYQTAIDLMNERNEKDAKHQSWRNSL